MIISASKYLAQAKPQPRFKLSQGLCKAAR